jgi:hypothetical protein
MHGGSISYRVDMHSIGYFINLGQLPPVYIVVRQQKENVRMLRITSFNS